MKRALLLLLLALPLSAAGTQPLTHETLWMMKRVGAPVVSPDGKWVAFSITEPSYDTKETSDDLWLVPSDGSSAPRRLTFSKSGESDVAWSPDSRRLAFSAKREGDEQNQVYLLDVIGGGESQRITTLSTGARRPRFSPDGKSISFVSTVWPNTADDAANKTAAKAEKDRKANVRIYESFPIRSWDRWLDDKQTHIFVQRLEAGAPARDLLAGTKLASEKGFGGAIGGEGPERIEVEWAPDGQSLLFAVTTTRNTSAYAEVPTDLYRARVAGGEPEKLTNGSGGYGSPRFSKDGRTLYASYEPNNKKLYNNTRLVAFDWPAMTNERRITPAAFDRSASGYSLSADGKSLYFTAEDSGHVNVYSVPAAGGEVTTVIAPERGVYSDLRNAEQAPVMVGRWSSSVNPAEIVRIDPVTKTHRNLTSVNTALAASLDWQAPQHFWFTSSRGRKIHNMVILPGGFDASKKYPLFVLMHGGPANMWGDSITLRWNYHLLAKPGYVVLLTNYTGSTGFGEKFAQDIQGDPLKGPAMDINEAADEAIKRYSFIDATRQYAGGASYGGHLANWMEATTTRYKALIAHAGLASLESQWGTSDVIYHRELMNNGPLWESGPLWREQSPIRYAASFKTPMMLSVGERDYRVPLNQTLEMWSALQRMQVPSKLLVWPDENHWIMNPENSRVFYTQVAEWLARW